MSVHVYNVKLFMKFQMYYDGLFFGRLDYQDKDVRQQKKTMEHVWMPSLMNLGNFKYLFFMGFQNDFKVFSFFSALIV